MVFVLVEVYNETEPEGVCVCVCMCLCAHMFVCTIDR